MPYLPFPNETPPGGWRYLQRETGIWFKDTHFRGLVAKVRKHRQYKELPLDSIEQDIIDQICYTLPDNCRPYNGEQWDPIRDQTRHMDGAKLRAANTALVDFMKSGEGLVDLDELERRQNICLHCPLNRPAATCACTWLYKLAAKIVPKDRRHEKLGVCAACGCSMILKTNLPHNVIKKSAAGYKFPEWCWQND